MNISLNNLVLQAVKEALRTAERQASQKRRISDISPESVANRFLTQLEESKSLGTNTNLYWITSLIETGNDLEECLELELIAQQLNEGFTEGSERNADNPSQYAFAVYQSS